MFRFWKISILFYILFFNLSEKTFAQKIDVKNYENKAQAYAILSAQYSSDSYFLSRQNYFLGNTQTIKKNCDAAISITKIAMEYADSAFNAAYDTCEYARSIILDVKKYQQQAIISFNQIRNSNSADLIQKLSSNSMYKMGNAIADAYKASLFFDWKRENTPAIEESEREITRLESDEYSYMTIKELYGKRLAEIDDEIVLLKAGVKNSSGKKLIEINNAIAQLKIEEKKCFQKMKSSEDRLIGVKNDLSEEMLKIVNKDIFTTDKEGFYNEEIPVPVDFEIPKGLVYKLQIGFFKSQLPPQHFDGIFPLSSQKVDEIYYRYVAGNFAKYEEAKIAKTTISEKGYSDSFVVAYIDGKKVSISEALKKEKGK